MLLPTNRPPTRYPVLVVHANAVAAVLVAFERLEAVAGGSVRNVRSAAAFTRSSLRATGQISRGMRRAAFELRRHISRRSPGCRELPDEQRV